MKLYAATFIASAAFLIQSLYIITNLDADQNQIDSQVYMDHEFFEGPIDY